MSFNFKSIIEDYCGTGRLSEEEVDFLEREHIKTMNKIIEWLTPSIANLLICEACNLGPGSFWIICNLQFLIILDLLKQASQELINYLMVYANIKFLLERTDVMR